MGIVDFGSVPPVGLGEERDGMRDPERHTALPATGHQLQEASRIPGGDDRRPCGDHVVHLPLEQLSRHFRLRQVVNPGTAAAPGRLGKVDEINSGNHPENLARLTADLLSVAQVAGLVVGHDLAGGIGCRRRRDTDLW